MKKPNHSNHTICFKMPSTCFKSTKESLDALIYVDKQTTGLMLDTKKYLTRLEITLRRSLCVLLKKKRIGGDQYRDILKNVTQLQLWKNATFPRKNWLRLDKRKVVHNLITAVIDIKD